jgi:Lar family restriction alleviation protein
MPDTPTPETPAELAAPELLPCPFCGTAPRIIRTRDQSLWSYDDVEKTQVYCSGCDVATDYTEEGQDPEAIEKWNTRATLAASSTAPAGFVLVPVEPTEAMLTAAHALPDVMNVGDEWRAMLAAASAPASCCEKAAPGRVCPACAEASAGYSAAMTPAAAERKPLTEDQVEEGRVTWLHGPAGMHPSGFHAGARFAERAHGITAAPAGSEGE